jgi:DNA-binding beta-propeller fold protein YncE
MGRAMVRSIGKRETARFASPNARFGVAALVAYFIAACAVEPVDYEAPTVDIDVTLTPIRDFSTGIVTQQGDLFQVGYAAAVAAAGGQTYVVDASVQGLVRIDDARGEARLVYELEDTSTSGVYVTTDLIVYVVDRQNRSVIELDESGWERRRFYDPRLIPAPVDVTETAFGGTVLIADELTQRLAMFDSMANATGMLASTLSPVTTATSIAAVAATDRYVFVLDRDSREVIQLDLNGRIVATYGEEELRLPVALAVDECERVFVADGHPDGLFVSARSEFGASSRAKLPPDITLAVTDLWVAGNELYVAAGAAGVQALIVDPPCMGL